MRTLLCLTLAGLLAGPALAGDKAPAAPHAALAPADAAATRAEIDRLVARIHELAGKLGDDEQVRVIRHLDGPGAPMAFALEMPELGKDIRIERVLGGPMVGVGVVLAPNPAAPGVRLAAVTPDGPAAKAGLRSGDVLLSVDGRKVAGSDEAALDSARELLHGLKKDQKLRLGYARAGRIGEASVVAGDIGRAMPMGPGDGFAWNSSDAPMAQGFTIIQPQIDREVRRLLPMAPCPPGADDCGMPALFEAFRWQGLNLASLDADLGRYFGTTQGVLVVSGAIKGLKSGDVLQRVDDKPVATPRDVMRALRDKAAGSNVSVLVLRDRRPVPLVIAVPEAHALPFLAPPAPPVPPTPPALPAPRAIPAVPAVPAVPAARARAAVPPPPPPAAPAPPETPDAY
jgi:hypothetical protein